MRKIASFPLSFKSLNQDGTFSGYASVFNIIDHDEEEVLVGAFSHSLTKWKAKGKMPKMLWQHDTKEVIGIWEEIREDERGLFVKGKLLLDVQRAREAYVLMQAGALDGLSVGFIPLQAVRNPVTKTRQLQSVDLFEISLVTFASNPLAKVTHLKETNFEQNREVGLLNSLVTIIRNATLN